MILVTGGAGYIGAHTNKALNQAGYETVVVDNLVKGYEDFVKWGHFENYNFGSKDLREVFEKYDIDGVLHFGAFSSVAESVELPQIDEFLSKMEAPVDIENISTDKTVIKVEDIYKRFYLFSGGEVLQIKDVNFDVKKENIVSLIGPSGAGKTVLLRMLADLELPDKGKVVYEVDGDWVDISMPSMQRMDVRRKLGFMYQEFALSYYATVLSQLATRLGYKNQNVVKQARKKAEKLGLGEELLDSLYALIDLPESEARDLLAKIGLMPDILEDLFPKFPETATKEAVKDIFELLDLPLDILYRKSYELSGGQEVRVMLALILISKPEFLLLDEPFGDLDPITLRIVANSLKKISKEYNITIIMISHNTDFVKEVSNRTLLMEDGKIVDDSEDVDKAVDNFINLCHADYLKEN